MLQRRQFSLVDVVNNILDKLPADIWTSSTTTFLDPAIGGGQFVKEIERRLFEAGHSNENIKSRVFGFEANKLRIKTTVGRLKLKGTYKKSDFISEDINMRFDYTVSNPPYNESSNSAKTIAGTSGNTTLYKKFIKKAFEISDNVAMVVQRTGIKFAIENYSVTKYDLDTSDHWDYTAGYFISLKDDNSQENISSNVILNKVYDITVKKAFRSAMGGSYASHLSGGAVTHDEQAGGVFGVVNTPTEGEGAVTGYILRKPIPAGPKLLFKGLESKKSYYVTDLPAHVGSGCAFMFDTMEEAEAARLFILNNPVVKYLQKLLREKTLGYVFRYMIDFDLSQIKTGFEYPAEWNLTADDIAFLEENI